jgi:hypothetical protein
MLCISTFRLYIRCFIVVFNQLCCLFYLSHIQIVFQELWRLANEKYWENIMMYIYLQKYYLADYEKECLNHDCDLKQYPMRICLESVNNTRCFQQLLKCISLRVTSSRLSNRTLSTSFI